MPEFAPVDINAFDNARSAQQTFESNAQQMDLRSQLEPYQVEDAKNQSLLGQYQVQGAQQMQALKQTQVDSASIAQAAKTASLSDDPATAWDDEMKALQEKGVTAAGQFIGRYSPLLADRVSNSYGTDATGAPGSRARATAQAQLSANNPVNYQQVFAGVPTEKLPDILGRTGQMMDALSKVRTADDWEAMKAAEVKAGFPAAANLGPYSPLSIPRLYNHLLGQFQYLQDRVTSASTGAPDQTQQPGKVQAVGGRLYNVTTDPNTGQPVATPITPAATTGGATASPGTPGAGLSLAGAAQRIQVAENSTGDPAAKNPMSSATGNGQFTNSTWLDLMEKTHPELKKSGMSDQDILALRSDPKMADQATQELAHQNAMDLMKDDHPITTSSLLLAHRFGSDGANKILNALPNTPVADVVGDKVMKANPNLAGLTVGQVVAGVVKQVGNDPVATEEGTAAAENAAGIASDATARGAAEQYVAGDPHALSNLGGQGKVGAANKVKAQGFVDQILAANGETRADLASRQATFSKTAGNFATGVEGRTIRSVNAAMAHLDVIRDLGQALDNGDVQAINTAKNRFKQAFGAVAPATFEALKPMVATEVAKAILSSGGGIADREEFKDALTSAQSFDQLQGVLNGYQGLFGGQLQAFRQQYQHGTGRNDFDSMLTPETKAVLDKLPAQSGGTKVAGGAGGGAAKPGKFQQGAVYKDKNGVSRRYNNGNWEPV